MRSMDDLLGIACGYLNDAGAEYVLVGGIAVIAYGTPRTTMDADFIIQMEPRGLREFAVFLRDNGLLCDPRDIEDAVREMSHFSAEDEGSLLRLDIRGVYTETDRRTLKNRRPMEYRGMSLYLASPEDVVLGKLLYGGDQNLRDAESILIRQQSKLDLRYLEETCKAEGIAEELERLRARVERHL